MKYTFLICLFTLATAASFAQSDQHYTMFMYNKLLYNPAYTGSRDATSVNAVYRDQWTEIQGAPKTLNLSVDGPVGNYMKPFRKVAIGVSIDNERIGVENNTDMMAYYAYRIKLDKSVLSFGLRAGSRIYTTNYNALNPFQQNDLNLAQNIKNAFLPNAGAGVYWSGDQFFLGASVPNLLQDYYDKNTKTVNISQSKEVRGYYFNGGYVFPVNETIKLEPQILARYAGNSQFNLPFNCDFNISAIAFDRILFGITYRTDKSFEGIVHVQAAKHINIGYAYDYLISPLQGYNGGAHEIVIGFDFSRDNSKYTTPRFVKPF